MHNNKKLVSLVEALSNAFGPSGFEDDAVAIIKKRVEPLGRVEEDSLRNLYVYLEGNTGNRPLVMLDAHSDEVGMIVQAIRPNGTIKFLGLGSWNSSSLPSAKVLVRNTLGEYLQGVIAAKPVHFMSEKEKNGSQGAEALYIDIGASSRDEAIEKYHIGIGEPIAPATVFEYDEKRDRMFGKGFDCRVGCAALIETLERLSTAELPVDIVGVFSSQEEVGERGVSVAVNKVKPDIAICFEGAPADDTFSEPWLTQTALGKGVMLRYMDRSIICNPRFMRHALKVANENAVCVQTSVREGGGNNGAIINLSNSGVPVIVAGVPVRYIHSPNCISSIGDLNSAIELVCAVVKSLDKNTIASF